MDIVTLQNENPSYFQDSHSSAKKTQQNLRLYGWKGLAGPVFRVFAIKLALLGIIKNLSEKWLMWLWMCAARTPTTTYPPNFRTEPQYSANLFELYESVKVYEWLIRYNLYI
jgi:hypothetical protein